MTVRSWLRVLGAGAAVSVCLLAPAGQAIAQEQYRCEGTVTDDQGNPMAGATVTFLHVATNRPAQPVKTSKRGKYAHNTLATSAYEIKAEMAGYKMAQITALSVRTNGDRATDETYPVGSDQKVHTVYVPPWRVSDSMTRAKCTVDIIMAPDEKYAEVWTKLHNEWLVREGKAPDPGAPGGQEPGAPGAPAAATTQDPLEKGKSLIASRDYAGAIEPLKEAIAATPDSVEAHRWLGGALLQVENLAEAEPELKKAIELDPNFTGANFDMGMLFVKKGRLMQAIPYFEKERELNPEATSVLQNLSKLYVDTKQYDKAVEIYNRLIETTPDNMENYALLADCYKQMGDSAKEQEVYQKMGTADSSGMAFYNLGNLMFNKDEKAKAAEAYKKAIEQNPQHADAHYQLGMTYVGLAKFKEAVAELGTFMKLKPDDARAAEAKSLIADLKKMGG